MRRKPAKIRKIIPDAKYHNVLVARFIDYLMLDGKKSVVEKAVYQSFSMLEEKLHRDPVEVFAEIVDRVTPRIEVRPRRVGGATYQIPCEVKERRGVALSLKWITTAVRNQSGKGLHNKILKVLMDILNNTGWAIKKREEVFKMAEANKAFAHFNW